MSKLYVSDDYKNNESILPVDNVIKDQSWSEKHNYVTKNINTSQYDKFIEYCSCKKEGGQDLNNWSIEDLDMLIKEYLLELNNNILLQSNINKINISDVNILNLNNKNIINEKSLKINNDVINIHKCKIANKSQLNFVEDIKVDIKNPILIETGLFSHDYILYDVKTSPFNWCVKRRYSDFDQLRNLLVKFYPGHLIPPIPPKKTGNKKFEDSFVNNRIYFLVLFINKILENDLLKSSDILINFLSQIDNTIFENKTKEYINNSISYKSSNIKANVLNLSSSNYLFNNYLDDYYSLTGELKLDYSEDNNDFNNSINDFNKVSEKILNDIEINAKHYLKSIKSACFSLDKIHKNLELYTSLFKKVNIKKDYSKLIQESSDFVKYWKKIISTQCKVFDKSILQLLNYNKHENMIFKTLVLEREEVNNRFNSEFKKLNIKKEKLWSIGDINKWETSENISDSDKVLSIKNKDIAFKHMCFRESNNVNELKAKVGFFNYRVKHEFSSLINSQYNRTKTHFKEFLDDFYPTITDGITIWTNFGNKLTCVE